MPLCLIGRLRRLEVAAANVVGFNLGRRAELPALRAPGAWSGYRGEANRTACPAGLPDARAGNAIADLIAQDPLWRQLDPVFRSIKGLADRTVARLMAEMPENWHTVQ